MDPKIWAMCPAAVTQYREFAAANKPASLSAIKEFEAKLESLDSEDPVFSGSTAIIKIQGMIRNRPSILSFMYSGNIISYAIISRQIASASENDKVEKIQLQVDSPGGAWDGMFEVLNIIKSTQKPIEAIVYGRADSAAYGIVSQADKIVALNTASEIGSIGLVQGFFIDEEFVTITSSDAPDKRPDVGTAEGTAVIRAELDEMHREFAKIIAEGRAAATGRPITEQIVNSDFGRGGTMLAEAGLAAGMIDEIQPAPERISNARFFQTSGADSSSAPGSIKNTGKKNMDLNELKQKYPDVYGAAAAEGVAQERERAQALLETGKSCGKIDYAIECVKDGKCITQPTVAGAFLSARVNNSDQENRAADDPATVTTADSSAGDAAAAADGKNDATLTKRYLESRRERGLSNVKS